MLQSVNSFKFYTNIYFRHEMNLNLSISMQNTCVFIQKRIFSIIYITYIIFYAFHRHFVVLVFLFSSFTWWTSAKYTNFKQSIYGLQWARSFPTKSTQNIVYWTCVQCFSYISSVFIIFTEWSIEDTITTKSAIAAKKYAVFTFYACACKNQDRQFFVLFSFCTAFTIFNSSQSFCHCYEIRSHGKRKTASGEAKFYWFWLFYRNTSTLIRILNSLHNVRC